MFNLTHKTFYLFIFLISFFTILSALYIEYILFIPACKLCLYQRIPYLISLIICFFGYFFNYSNVWLYLLVVTFLSSMGISGYHVGIEKGIFMEFSGCTNENLGTIDKNELLKSLNSFLPSCKDAIFKIFGLSLATINFIFSFALALIIASYLRYEKNR